MTNPSLSPRQQFDLALTRLAAGAGGEADALARELTRAHPGNGLGWLLLGIMALMRGGDEDALAPLRRAAELMPGHPAALDNLGLALFRLGRHDQASDCFRKALRLAPDNPGTLVNAAANAHALGDHALAEKLARRALERQPGNAAALLNLGNALGGQGKIEPAQAAFRRALEADPGYAEARLSLGALLEGLGDVPGALAEFDTALALRPDYWPAMVNLGRAHASLGHLDQAMAHYRRALALNPGYSEARSGMLFLMMHDDRLDPDAKLQAHLDFGRDLAHLYDPATCRHDNARDPERPLRVGFVSGDLRNHAVAHFLEPYLSAWRGSGLELYAYANSPIEDEVSARIRAHMRSWRNVTGMGDEALAARIRADAIDILVDLSGHTALNRLAVFARKPAPVQVTWIGYPATTGLATMDYRTSYRALAKLGNLGGQFTEKFVYLPCSSPFEPAPDAPDVGAPPVLRRGHVTFGSFNRSGKVSDQSLELWSRVLHAVPDAVMLLGAIDGDATRLGLVERFARLGIPEGRLEFRPRTSMPEYLALHHEVDIILDTLPYNGGTTSRHALWMGVPILSLVGDTLPQRVGAAIMIGAGLDTWVAMTADAFVARAVEAAVDTETLTVLRRTLRERMRDRPDGQPGYAAQCMERAFRGMWRRWCAGLPPEDFEVDA